MAPSRGNAKTRAPSNAGPSSSRSTRASRATRQAPPDAYQDLLAEAADTEPRDAIPKRPLKKRKVAKNVSAPKETVNGKIDLAERNDSTLAKGAQPIEAGEGTQKGGNVKLQTVEDSSDDEDESDIDFEDVDLNQATNSASARDEDDAGIADLSITVEPTTAPTRSAQAKRKPATVAEKEHRLLVHKAHVTCLLVHCLYVNSWCNDETVQDILRPVISEKHVTFLHYDGQSQFQRNRLFVEAVQQASDAFRGHFRVKGSGIKRPEWAPEGENIKLDPDMDVLDRAAFITAAKTLEGSQDTGNQLFCALLRSVGVDARIVCSLQVLPYTNIPTKSSTPQKSKKSTFYANPAFNTDSGPSENEHTDSSIKSSSAYGKVPSARRRLGQPSLEPTSARAAPLPQQRPTRKLKYPVFWVEAFNVAHQKWTPIDPLVTQTFGQVSKFEPPSSYDLNQLSYAIAFEDDSVARDVTRRYAKAFNAKTRRQRVEASDGGAQWLRKTLRFFRRRGGALDRDQVEDAELAQKEAREGLPTNVLDFKDHPYYALERHLKRHEVLHPKREAGKVNAGTAAKPRMEVVFRRQDVKACRSADKWYRVGRVVKAGEQPVKHVPARRPRREMSEDEGEQLTSLYAEFQTDLYVQPPVVKGRIPRNTFGNLDIYVPSMVPAGGAHVRHPLVRQAAAILKVDCADAVTGFTFKGRQGTAVVVGAVVPAAYEDAVNAVIDGLQDQAAEEESMQRSAAALRMWKRFLIGLRITERVSAYGDPEAKGKEVRKEVDEVEDEEHRTAEAGGFLPEDRGDEVVAMPTAGRFSLSELGLAAKQSKKASKRKVESSEDESMLSASEDAADEEVERPTGVRRGGRRVVDENEEDEHLSDAEEAPNASGSQESEEGGGFLVEDAQADGAPGGFLPDPIVTSDLAGPAGGGGFLVEDEHPEGGFLPDANEPSNMDHTHQAGLEQEEGGFLLDQDNPGPQDDQDESQRNPTAPVAPVEDHGRPPEALKDLEEISSLAKTEKAASPTSAPINPNISTAPSQPEDADSKHAAKSSSPALPQIADDRGGDSDRGSLLSHDPDDEDAEPDWLESD